MATFKRALVLLLLFAIVCAASADDGSAAAADGLSTEKSAEDLAAEEAAALFVEQQAEEEDDEDGGDAMDEDADSARPHADRHPLANLPAASGDVTVGHAFVSGGLASGGDTLTLGEEVCVMIGLANGARTRMHVWGVTGSLNDVSRSNVHVQNLTYTLINATASANSELSMQYSFTPNDRLDTRPFQLALTVLYEAQTADGNALRGYSTTFYNSTVATRAGPQTVSNTAFLGLATLFVTLCAGAVAYLFAPSAEGGETKGASATGAAESTTSAWLEEHHNTMTRGGGRAARATKRR